MGVLVPCFLSVPFHSLDTLSKFACVDRAKRIGSSRIYTLAYNPIVFFAVLSLLLTSSTMALTSDFPTSVDFFSGRFYKQSTSKTPRENVVMSALSADMVLTMVALGAQGDTKKELTDALFIEDIDTILPSIAKTIDALNGAKGVTLNLANKVYVKASSSSELDAIIPTYKSSIQDVFRSEIKQIDFSKNVEAAAEINGWVEGKTNKRIKDLIDKDSLDGLTAAVLVNAIYFKGSWKRKFDPAQTHKEDFHLIDGSTRKVDMMNQKAKFLYKESKELDAKILILPYEAEEVSMAIFLPNKIDGLAALEDKLASGTKEHLQDMYSVEVIVKLPKFKIETTIDVKKVLQNMGVKLLFDPSKAQLKGILNDDTQLYVSEAVQKAFIEVNEEGAEAAAATAVFMARQSLIMPSPPQLRFTADRPFYYQITYNYSKQALFSGVLSTV